MKKAIGKRNASNRLTWLKGKLKSIPPNSSILDVGAGECKHKPLCKHLRYTSQDFCQYNTKEDAAGLHRKKWDQSKIDIVSDILSIPVEDASFDAVMCTEVMEHIPDPIAAIREMNRVLRIGGVLILTAPFGSLTHFSPYYYYSGFSRNFYEHFMNECGFKIDEMSYNGNFFEYLAQEVRRVPTVAKRYSKTDITAKDKKVIKNMVALLDRVNKNNRSYELLCHGIHVLAIKEKTCSQS